MRDYVVHRIAALFTAALWIAACSEGTPVVGPGAGTDTGSSQGTPTSGTPTTPVDTGVITPSTSTAQPSSDTGDTKPTGSTDTPPGAVTCTPETAATACGADGHCVDGYCCDAPCDGPCASCAVPGKEGTCQLLDYTTVCREAAGPCDLEERCDGENAQCPEDLFLGPTNACREASGPCDEPEYCTGDSVSCPDDAWKPEGTVCDPGVVNDCVAASTCDAEGNCQPNYAPAGTPCSTGEAACLAGAACDGQGNCVGTGAPKPDGTPCGDRGETDCDKPDVCMSGTCVPNYAEEGAACGDPTQTDCDFADTCDGQGHCLANRQPPGTPCGDPTNNECNFRDTCNAAGECLPNLVPAGTACGDQTDDDCTHPDTCDGAGACVSNDEPDFTPCGTPNIEYRCSTSGCGASAQRRNAGSWCSSGACTPIADPQWEIIDACTPNDLCEADTDGARCVPCDAPPADSCDADLVSTYFDPLGVCDDSSGTPTCHYEPIVEDCLAQGLNCAKGRCTPFTCVPAEKDTLFGWDDESDDMGWTLNPPWIHTTGNHPFAWNQVHLMATTTGGIADPEAAALVSPPLEFAACSALSLSFAFVMRDGYPLCNPPAEVALQCDPGTGWQDLWVYQEKGPGFSENLQSITDVDASACTSESVRFRFVLRNFCGLVNGQDAVEEVQIDDLRIAVTP